MQLNPFKKERRIYLDYAAATPLDPRVRKAMEPFWTAEFGNPSAIHKEGQRARDAVESARAQIARMLSVRPSAVTFTAGGTESNNVALQGFVGACRLRGMRPDEIEIISIRTEHPSILKTLDALAAEGTAVTYVPVHEDGTIDIAHLESALTPQTKLVTIAYANSETGVVQDLGRIGRVLEAHERKHGVAIAFHTDASQAPLGLPLKLEQLRVDMMTLDAGKFCGPKGSGVLVHRNHEELARIVTGGSQEGGLRPGTENVPGIVGIAEALTIAIEGREARSALVANIRDYGIQKLEAIGGVVLNGSRTSRLPNNINISIPGLDTEFAVVSLDAKGIACSTKSACSGAGSGMSGVVFEMTQDTARASATIRLTLGERTSREDMDRVAEVLEAHVHQMSTFKALE